MLTPEATTAGVAALIGGVFLKLIEKLWLSKTVVDEHAVLRKELREELDAVKEEIASLRDEVDEWREKYYSQVETTNELLKVFSKHYPDKIDLLLYIIQTLNSIHINPFTKNNLENIKDSMKKEYLVILGELS